MSTEIRNKIRPVFSGHETFPLRYGWLKKIFDASLLIEKEEKSISKDLFNSPDSITILGVGKNMVSSMRYWATFCKLLELKDDGLFLTSNAKLIYDDNGLDPWMENPATLWLIHWNLATNRELLTYYDFFNKFNTYHFDKNELYSFIVKDLNDANYKVAEKTLKRDIDCFLKVYSTTTLKNDSGEECFESPLVELGLITPFSKRDIFEKKKGAKSTLSIYTFLYGLFSFWGKYYSSSKSISVDTLCYTEESPGKIFLLDVDSISNYLFNLEDVTNGLLEWSETAGLKQIFLTKEIEDFQKTSFEFFKRNYE